MIIKFYNNGWNYIDEVENVKWINKMVDMAIGLDSNKDEQHIKGRIYIKKSDGRQIYPEDLQKQIRTEIEYQLSEYNKVQYGTLKECVDYDEISRLLHKGKTTYVRLLIYDKGDKREALAFTHVGYLLNNIGQTIEKLG